MVLELLLATVCFCSKYNLTGSVLQKQTVGFSFGTWEFDIWVLFSDESVVFCSIFIRFRAAGANAFLLLLFFICHAIIFMLWPHLLMNAASKTRIQLLLGQTGPL